MEHNINRQNNPSVDFCPCTVIKMRAYSTLSWPTRSQTRQHFCPIAGWYGARCGIPVYRVEGKPSQVLRKQLHRVTDRNYHESLPRTTHADDIMYSHNLLRLLDLFASIASSFLSSTLFKNSTFSKYPPPLRLASNSSFIAESR